MSLIVSESLDTYMVASFPDFPALGREDVYTGTAWYLFSCDHDVIKIGPEFLEQKGNVLHVCSTNYAFNDRCV